MTPKFELGQDFCTLHLPCKFHQPVFTRSEVTVLTNKQMPMKTSNALGYATTLGNDAWDGSVVLSGCVQAQQQIPDWLEEMSTSTVGVGGFTGAGGRFDAKDSRRGNVRCLLLLPLFVCTCLWRNLISQRTMCSLHCCHDVRLSVWDGMHGDRTLHFDTD